MEDSMNTALAETEVTTLAQRPVVAEYVDALWALNLAINSVMRASRDTTALPHIDRQSIRLIGAEVSRLIADGENSGMTDSRITAARLDSAA
jgi:hypothetical protein